MNRRNILWSAVSAVGAALGASSAKAATESHSDPLERLKVAVELLYEASRPDPAAKRPLFTDFAPRLLVTHPVEVKVAHAPLVALLTELMEAASDAGLLRVEVNPKRVAAAAGKPPATASFKCDCSTGYAASFASPFQSKLMPWPGRVGARAMPWSSTSVCSI